MGSVSIAVWGQVMGLVWQLQEERLGEDWAYFLRRTSSHRAFSLQGGPRSLWLIALFSSQSLSALGMF